MNKVVTTEDNEIGIEVRYQGYNTVFTPERIVAAILTELARICRNNECVASDIVLSIPGYYNEFERQALLNAAKIAEIPCVRLMNEMTATALNYGIFRKNEFTTDPRIVVFIDVGHCKTSVAVVAFTTDKLVVLGQAHDRNLGGRNFDWRIMEYFANEFEKKYKLNPLRESPRAKLKLLSGVEKLRKELSANIESNINIEYLVEDYDLSQSFKREQLEMLCEDVLNRFGPVIDSALDQAGVTTVEFAEIVGGCTLMPSVQAKLTERLGVELKKTLHVDESVARGAAVQAAIISPLYQVKEFAIQDVTLYPIGYNCCQLDMPIEDNPLQPLFTNKNIFPVIKQMTFNQNQPFQITLGYTDMGLLPDGIANHIGSWNIMAPTEETPYKIKVTIRMNASGMVSVESAERVEVYYEEVEVKKPVEEAKTEEPKAEEAKPEDQATSEEPKEGEETPAEPASDAAEAAPMEPAEPAEPAEPLKEMKRKTRKIKIDIVPVTANDRCVVIDKYQKEEHRMKDEDRIAREIQQVKYDLESSVYDYRDKVNGLYGIYVETGMKGTILQQLGDVESWLYNEGADTIKSVYIEKLQGLREVLDPIVQRYTIFTLFPDRVAELQGVIEDAIYQASSTHKDHEHIPQEDRDKITAKCQEARTWIALQSEVLDNTPKTQNPDLNLDEITRWSIQVQEIRNSVMSKPKPPPPAEEKKPEESAKPEEAKAEGQESMDVEPDVNAEEPMDLD